MEIRHLKLVKTVAEEGNLTNAGKKLYLSQSALSHQLRELETNFGTPLFQRINKRMVLTLVGTRVLQTANSVLSELQKTEVDVRNFVSGETGVLRISTECYTCYHWLPKLLTSYSKHFPNVEVQILAEATRRPEQYLLDGKLDLAVLSCLTKNKVDSHFNFTELFTDEMVVVVSAEHRLAHKQAIKPEDFREEHLLCYTAPMETLDVFQRVLMPAGVRPKKTSKIQLTEAIIEMVKANLGISVMARWAVRPYLRSKKIVTIPVRNHQLQRTWYAVTLNGMNNPKFLDCFVEHMIKHPIA